MILRAAGEDTEALFIQRADRAGDPWSGHMAFPGGHREPEDASLRTAAIRETREEIGLDISCAPLLAALPPLRPLTANRDLLVAPFVFELDGCARLRFSREVADAIWSPLAPLHRGECDDSGRPLGPAMRFAGYRLAGGQFVWGITYRMVQALFREIDPGYACARR